MEYRRTWEVIFTVFYLFVGLHIAWVNSIELSAVGMPVWDCSTLVYHALWWVTPVMAAVAGTLLAFRKEARFAVLFAAIGQLFVNPPASIGSMERYLMFVLACGGLVFFGSTLGAIRNERR